MPGEFVISPRHPLSSQPISPFRSSAQDKNQPQDMETQAQSEPQPSYESLDSMSKGKQKAESSSPKFSMRAAISHAVHKLSPSHSRSANKNADVLAGSEEEFERMKRQEAEEQKRKQEHEAFGLGKKKGFAPGSMQMHG